MNVYNPARGQGQPQVVGRRHTREFDAAAPRWFPPYYLKTIRQELTPDGQHVRWYVLRWLHAPAGAGEVRVTPAEGLSFRKTCRASLRQIGWSPMMVMSKPITETRWSFAVNDALYEMKGQPRWPGDWSTLR
jgi:hypothetical protein